MNHKNTSDIIRVVTSSSADIDIVTNYIIQGQAEEKNDYVKVAAATNTDIALPDTATSLITSLCIRNIHASTSNTVGIYKRLSSTDYLIFECPLAAGESIIYTQERGFTVYTSTGKIKVETGSGGSGTAWGDITGTLSDQTDLQAELDLKAPIASPTFTGTVSGITKSMVGLSNVDNTSDVNKPVSTLQAAADASTLASAQSYADALVIGLLDDRGNYDASGNAFPSSGGSGTAGAILKGDLWTISVAGTLGGHPVTAGDVVRSLIDTPGTTDSNWAISENNFGYVAENSSNKDTDGTLAANSDTKYSSQKAVKTYADTKQPLDSDLTTIAGLTATTDNFIQSKSNAWASRTVAQVKTDLGISSVVNTLDGNNGTLTLGVLTFGLTGKATPVDGDSVPLSDSSATNGSKKLLWSDLKATIAAYYNSFTATLTNKRITPRITTITSSATPAINTDDCDAITITALAAAITSMTSSLTGTPTNFQKLTIRIKDNGTARAITWGASFEAKGVALPTTTVISKVLTVGFIYDTVTSKWGCVASAQEA